MRLFLRYWVFLILLTVTWGCGQKGAKLQKSVVPPDKTLFETGQEYLDKSQFIKGRLAFQTLINTYPDSEFSAESYLAIGDSFYDEGGTENLVQAEDQYKNFIVFFPTHPKAVDAQMKIASLNMKMMRDPDRDPSYSIKAEAALKKLIEQFPDSKYVPTAKEFLTDVQENLAQGNFGVAKYYFDRGRYRAATSRLKENLERYPDFSAMDQNYHMLAQSLEKSENSDEAAIYYGRIAAGFPFSPYFEDAKARLEAMGKDLPAVDTQLAALNQSRQKPSEGFSPLKPFKEFASALGFLGPPDPYEAAKKAAEASTADASGTQAAAGPESGRPGDEALIQATLKKSSTGETEATTVVGANPNETEKGTDKNGDKKKGSKKDNNKKKNNNRKPF